MDDPVARWRVEKFSLERSPRRPLILLSFRSHGIYSRALFSEDLTKKLRPSNSFESRRAYREIINRTARHDAARRLPLLLLGKSRKSNAVSFGHVQVRARDCKYLRRRSRFHIERVFFLNFLNCLRECFSQMSKSYTRCGRK